MLLTRYKMLSVTMILFIVVSLQLFDIIEHNSIASLQLSGNSGSMGSPATRYEFRHSKVTGFSHAFQLFTAYFFCTNSREEPQYFIKLSNIISRPCVYRDIHRKEPNPYPLMVTSEPRLPEVGFMVLISGRTL